MYHRKFLRVTLLILILALLTGCAAAPDLNRPWNTATPKPGSKSGSQTTAATAVPGASSANTTANQAPVISNTAITIVGTEDNPPFMYADAKGEPAGLYPILLQAAFERMGMTLTIKTFPWNRALAMGQNGEYPLGGIYKNEERMKVFDYSDAIYPNKILVYVQRGKTFNFASPADLAGKSVGIMSGWTYGDEFDKAKAAGSFTTEEVSSDKDNLEKLSLGRLDCVLAESTIAEQIIRANGYDLEALPTPLIVFDAYLVFAKSMNQTDLVQKFNTTLAEMKQDGTYDQLINDFLRK